MKKKRTTIAAIALMITTFIIVSPTMARQYYNTPQEFYDMEHTNPFVNGSYLEYNIRADIIREWNYTIDDMSIHTHNGSLYYEPEVSGMITIRLNVTNILPDNKLEIVVSYFADTPIGYEIDTKILLNLNPMTGECNIRNGSLIGFEGILTLLYSEENPPPGTVISQLDSLNVTIPSTDIDVGINILDEYQIARVYDCFNYDSVDGRLQHQRYFDEDTAIYTRAFGDIGDSVLLGLANISYVVGLMDLVSTNLDLGVALVVPIDPAAYSAIFVAIGGIAFFLIMYVMFYRSQRRSGKRKKGKGRTG
ncbi:MAG: hypothetical protein ACTSUO_05520 [Candidatus Thorarchaeota archaeon]